MTIKGFIAQSSGSGSMNTGTIRVAYFREWIGFFFGGIFVEQAIDEI